MPDIDPKCSCCDLTVSQHWFEYGVWHPHEPVMLDPRPGLMPGGGD